jgi:ATP-dependent RNA helicase RhlE
MLVFTRTKHRANRLADGLVKRGVAADRIHGNRSQTQRTQALDAFKAGRLRVLVATDIVARGIDIVSLSHVVNFDVPGMAEDYVHRVGRTARAEAVGDAFTLVSPQEESDFRAIEQAIGRRIERRMLHGFDYSARAAERLEVPLAERIAAIRTRRAEERARSRAGAERRPPSMPAAGRGVDAAPAGRRWGGPTRAHAPAGHPGAGNASGAGWRRVDRAPAARPTPGRLGRP